MVSEIEKKYLIMENGIWPDQTTGDASKNLVRRLAMDEITHGELSGSQTRTPVLQGYIPLEYGSIIGRKLGLETGFGIAEARLRSKGNRFFFTLKGDGTLSREEQEAEIDEATFLENWPFTLGRRIEKVRLTTPYRGLIAEIDVFKDRELVTAEVECPDLKTARELQPLGIDITEDKRYKNKNLAK